MIRRRFLALAFAAIVTMHVPVERWGTKEKVNRYNADAWDPARRLRPSADARVFDISGFRQVTIRTSIGEERLGW